MKTKEELAKRSRKFTLIKRQADEPTIVIASDWGGEEIPWNELIEVEESSRVRLLESRIAELEEKLKIAVVALRFYSEGAGVECIDEGRNYMPHYVAYENDFDNDGGLDSKIGTRAKKALAKIIEDEDR